MSLTTRELLEPWSLPKSSAQDLALVVLLEYKFRYEQQETILKNINISPISEKFLAMMRTAGRMLLYPIAILLDWIMAGHLVDKLVLLPDGFCYQYSYVKSEELGKEHIAGLYLYNLYERDLPSCPVYYNLMGKLGLQDVKCSQCRHFKTDAVELTMTDAQTRDFKAKLIDTDNDPAGLANIKKRCKDAIPSSGFTRNVSIKYIKAGPGCGKSYLIRQLATTSDLVLAPFTKLKPDYENPVNETGEKYDLMFKTTHRAMESRECRRIFADEFTSMPYECPACIAEVNDAEEIFLVGDKKQTKAQEPGERIYISNHIDLTKLSTHILLVNFRNPQDTVALLKKMYDYKMRAHSILRSKGQ